MSGVLIRNIRFTSGIVNGDDMRDLLEILPELESSFIQRKSFDEYYFNSKSIQIDISKLDQLSSMFLIRMNWEDITLEN
jgi:hypothetical protein